MIPVNLNNFNQIGEDIYVCKNFLSNEDLLTINNEIDLEKESLWDTKNISKEIKSLIIIHNKIKKIVKDPYQITNSSTMNILSIGDTWGLHSDNGAFLDVRKQSLLLKEGEEFILKNNNVFGTVTYINDFGGGELRYPNQSIIYKPEPGDLVIHSAEDHCTHEVLKVTSGVRYSYSNGIYEKIKVPKYLSI
jgi:hypothetical protein